MKREQNLLADMAIYPWTVSHEWQNQDLVDFPNVHRRFNAIKARPATARAYEWVAKIHPPKPSLPLLERALPAKEPPVMHRRAGWPIREQSSLPQGNHRQ